MTAWQNTVVSLSLHGTLGVVFNTQEPKKRKEIMRVTRFPLGPANTMSSLVLTHEWIGCYSLLGLRTAWQEEVEEDRRPGNYWRIVRPHTCSLSRRPPPPFQTGERGYTPACLLEQKEKPCSF